MNYTTTRKRATCLLTALMLSGTLLQAQTANRLARTVQQELLMNNASGYALFEPSAQQDPALNKEIAHVVYLKLHKEVLRSLHSTNNHLISFSLPLAAGTQPFTLYSYNILDDGFKVYERGSDGLKKEVKMNMGSFYRGTLDGSPNSLAAFTFTDDEVSAVFSSPDGGNYNLVLNYNDPGPDRDQYILFREKDVKNTLPAGCAVTDEMDMAGGEPGPAARGTFASCHRMRVSMNADYKLFQIRGSVAASANYLASLFNMISTLYANEGIMTVMSEAVVNSAQDNYTYGSSSELLYRFSEVIRNSFNGDIAQLVSGYKQGGSPPLGGLAWLDVLCKVPTKVGTVWTGPFSISDNNILNNIPQVPIYSWDVEASTHEMGHNIGSPHTQSCRWPGGPIDNCVAIEDGDCEPGPAPDPSGGTIMSYCHLTPVGINLALGFGPLPGDLLRKNILNRSCLVSYMPSQTLITAGKTRVANRQCSDGQWISFYYDNNTATEDDDELLLMIDARGQDIGNVDVTGFEVSMTTDAAYSSGTGRAIAAPYVTGDWKEANRSWQIKLPAGTAQPAAAVGLRFPFTDQDVLDIKGSLPGLARASQLSVMAFNNAAAAATPGTAAADAVNYYTNAAVADARHWSLGSTGKYNYAEFESSYGLYGGSIGFKTPEAKTSLDLYPNPATNWLNINVPVSAATSSYALSITDQLGRVIVRKTYDVASGGNIRLDVGSFARGVYNIRYVGGGDTYNTRFVKK